VVNRRRLGRIDPNPSFWFPLDEAKTRIFKQMNHRLFQPAMSVDTPRLTMLFEQLSLTDLDQMTIGDLLRHGQGAEDAGVAVILALMFAALSEGSLCLDLDRQSIIQSLGEGMDADVDDQINAFLCRLEQGAYDGLIDRGGQGDFKPLVLDHRSGRQLLYFQKFHYHEQRLKHRLDMMLQPRAQGGGGDDQVLTQIIDDLYQEPTIIRKGAGGVPIDKDPSQIDAIRAALSTPLLVVSGGPGTGKTSLLVNILRALVRTGTDPGRILLAAPTGRAAQRMTEALHANLASIARLEPGEQRLGQLSGSTLHKLLIYNSRRGGFRYGETCSLPADVVAVDEVSMVDVVMMDHLFQAIDPARTKVILIGDKDQLPSVEAGSVLADISAAAHPFMTNHLVVLKKVYRSAGKLLDLARSINAGKSVGLPSVDFAGAVAQPSGNWSFVAATDRDQLNRHLDRWLWHHFFEPPDDHAHSYVDGVNQVAALPADSQARRDWINRLFAFVHRCRILTVVRHGPTGMQWINNRIAGALKPCLDPDASPQSRLFNGALIMITRNDYDRELFNGDVGVVLRQPDGGYRAWFRRVNGIEAFPAAGLTDCELAFAMTVHKSQGSEFDDTLLILPEDSKHRLLTREIIYTAATRAAKRLIIHGSEAAFQTALRRKIQRQSGL
jgi:exodeoxyribonuclease V alpha subunit